MLLKKKKLPHSPFHFPGQSLQELGKDKSSLKAAENHTSQFLKHLNSVEKKLSDQIQYLTQVSTGQPHEGSGYGSAKVLQMAWHRISHVKSRIRELEETKQKYYQSQGAGQGALRGRANGGGIGPDGAASGRPAVVNQGPANIQSQQQQQPPTNQVPQPNQQ